MNWVVVINGEESKLVFSTKKQARVRAEKINHQARNGLECIIKQTSKPVTVK